MSKVKIVRNKNGIRELLQSDWIQGILKDKADDIAKKCEGTYETDIYIGRERANSSITTSDWSTYKRNLKGNELLKALD